MKKGTSRAGVPICILGIPLTQRLKAHKTNECRETMTVRSKIIMKRQYL